MNTATLAPPVPAPGGTPVRQSLLEGYQVTVTGGTYNTQHIAVKPDYWFITLISSSGSIQVNPSASPGTTPAFPLAAGGYLKLPALGREITFINTGGTDLTVNFWAVINYDLAVFSPPGSGGGSASDVTIVGPLNGSGYVETAVESLPAVTLASGQTVDIGNFPATQPVSGSVDVTNFPATQDVSFNGTAQPVSISGTPTVDVGNFPGTQPVSGSVSISNFPATQPVDGTVTVEGKAASGSAVSGDPVLVAGSDGTDARTLHTDTSGNLGVNVENFPASQAVTGTFWQATQPVSGTITIGNPDAIQIQAGQHCISITPSDSVAVADTLRALYIGGAGNVAIKATTDSTAVTFVGVPAGSILPVSANYVMATNTTATNIVGIY